ncbi:SDR family NAD(P)-dependent oxidoreductase [Falsiroseomonas sp.]|uniref:SDR family NAD(P)-dependent oxidoreductase n=1 Tax=Falsiroseomonas sp. TaxID=2870721 RepID=UPI003F6E624D
MSTDHIAIIGMAGRFPGAPDLDAFWRNLMQGRESIRRFTPAELRAAGFAEAAIADPRLVPAFGALADVDRFDAGFFGFPASRAALLDPQQRLLLECAWHALEDAGYGPGAQDAVIGTYLSMTASTYDTGAAADLGDGFFALTSRDKDYAATRIAWRLDLTGPALMVQTACSGSLAAVHLAAEALLSGQCDMAIAGGCSVTLPQGGYRQAEGLMLSATGQLRAFDAAADGAVPGNGLGIVVLKPLSQAMADGDRVLAVIRGSAMNNDGARKADFLAPSVTGQRRAIAEALAMADVPAASLGMVECHGTGTALGDPVELRALAQAHGQAEGEARCLIGSVKGNIGHLNAAGGIAGLIKAVLALHHGQVPPSLHFQRINPEIPLQQTPFAVAAEARGWPTKPGPRRAGVSSFGFGGTNVHVVLEQAPDLPARPEHAGPVVLALSAKDPKALDRVALALAAALEGEAAPALADVAWTLAAGRQHFGCRRAVCVQDRAQAVAALRGGLQAPLPEAAARWCAGEAVAPAALCGLAKGRRVPLPGYPFAAERHWHRAPQPAPVVAAGGSLLERLRRLFAETLQEPPEKLDPDATWDRFGIDSLLVGTLTAELKKTYPTLRSTVLFEHDTLNRLAAHLADLEPVVAAPAIAPQREPIAVIGLAVRLPGAPDLDAFWQLLREGRSGITPVPAERWQGAGHGGFIADIEAFDPLLFGISPREARLIDPQARLALQSAWHAIEDAGYSRAGLRASAQGRDVGVFMGVMNMPWRLLGLAAAEAGHVVQGNHWSVANRISHHFDFGGPSLAVDTGCSASLTALHLACESLRRGECGVALAGGVNLILHPVQQAELRRTGVLAQGAECHVFGAAADGFVQGEGVGVAVLKPLSRALADGDAIHGVILGSAVNAGGRTAGYTVPSPRAQAAVVQAAITAAGVAADSLGYVECHGTATVLGDPVEIAGLGDGLRAAGRSAEAGALPIGSAKANIGHLESAAGIAGLAKLLLQLRHAEIAPAIHAQPPNPRIDFGLGPFVVPREVLPWPGATRRGGVSSFGAGGANAHLVAESAPPLAQRDIAETPCLVRLSARTPEALRAYAERLAAHLAESRDALADIAWTLAEREAQEHVLTLCVPDVPALCAALRRWLADGTLPPMQAVSPPVAARRVHLPGTVFAQERLWLPELAREAPRGLLGAAIPCLGAEARWHVALPAAHPVLVQHRVGDRALLPGVAVLELVQAALAALGRATLPLQLRDLTWLAPGEAREAGLAAQLVLAPGAAEALDVRLEQDGRVLLRGQVVPFAEVPDAPLADAAACHETLDGAAVYARLDALGLNYGPGFRAITRLAMGEAEAVSELAWPEEPALAACRLHPGLLDAVLQTAAMLVFRRPGAVRLLPMAVESVQVLGPLPRQGRVEARLLTAPDRLEVAAFDAVLRDEAGRAVVAFRGLAGRIDRALAEPALGDWFLTPGWVAAPVAPAPALAPPLRLAAPGAALEEAEVLPPEDWAARVAQAAPENLVLACAEAEALPLAVFRTLRALRQARGPAPTRLLLLAPEQAGRATPACAAAMALLRVAHREWPEWRLAWAWLDDWRQAAAALAEPGDALAREVAWRGGTRFLRALHPLAVAQAAPVWRQGGHALILGGAGGIGLALAERLAQRQGMRLTLIGRRAEPVAALAPLRAAGAEILYLQADATAPGDLARAVAAARARFGPVHAAIHSAILMQDASLERMSEASFAAALAVKAAGTRALAEAVATEPLDVLALFSSVNSFAANAGQANYVAGCAYKDALGLELAARGLPVRVVNWGFWGEVGRVADDAHRERLARRGVQPIGTAEGLAALDAILALPDAPQVAVLKGEAKLRAALGVVEAAPTLDAAMRAHVAAEAPAMQGAWDEYAAIEALSRRRLLAWWKAAALLLPGARATEAQLAAQLGVVPRHARLFAALLEILEREGALRREGDALIGQPREPGDLATEIRNFVAAHPPFAAHAALLETCLGALTQVLRGERLATEVMFPGSSLDLVQGIYRGNRLGDFCNRLVAAAVAGAVRKPGPVRVLEVGAGTGGTSRSVLAQLDARGDVDYVYTDISLAFAQFGRREFGATRPWLSGRMLDVTRDPATQGQQAESCDVVLGANVVHATPDLVRSLSHIRWLLKPGGVLVLYEMTAIHDFGTLTFGLLDGWWMAEDARLPHAPLLDVAGWRARLAAAGFGEVSVFSEPGLTAESQFRHAVIVARNVAAAVPAAAPRGMRERLRRRAEPEGTAPADLVALIRATVAEVLEMRLEDVRPDRSFADYGADSILGVALVAALAEKLGVALNPTVLFNHETVEKLARHLAARHGEALRLPQAAPRSESTGPAPIAVIGWSGRFPGAGDIETLWRNMRDGVDSVGPVPASRWNHAALRAPQPLCPDGGFLEDIESFDPLFFGLSPAEATAIDPQQRLFLQAAWHALEDAGHGPASLSGRTCGVFAGTVAGDYEARLAQAGRAPDARSFTGNAASMLAARIAYRLDLHGPCLSVDTACSSSLVALHLAAESLRRGECDLALAGGVAVMTTPEFYLAATQAGMLSPTGRCRTLDAAADGFVPAEAVACLVLKRLPDALRDGDEVRGVILASGVNQDGASNGITAPNGAAQAALLREVWSRAGIAPADLGYVELHGTGTRLGDPVELGALHEAFGDVAPARCAVGSAKANLGHTLAAAGVVGLIRALLVLRHGVVPPAVNFAQANPLLPLGADSPFVVPRAAQPLGGRLAAVSAFGFSGTNAHAVLAPPPPRAAPDRAPRADHLAVLSAETAEALVQRRVDLAAWIAEHPEAEIADICATLALGRTHHRAHRAAYVVADTAALRDALAREENLATTPEARAYLVGDAPDWLALHPPGSFARLALPPYPFARRRCWPDDAPQSRLFDSVMADLAAEGGA